MSSDALENMDEEIKGGVVTFSEMAMNPNTPAMKQFVEIKQDYMEYLLFYRMGDFYELFFEDAVTASQALGLTLTSRSKMDGRQIPMCGVPFHAYELYLSRLIKMGYKVAICEQLEDPKEAKQRGGYKAIVKRDVVRLVTAGTLTEDTLLEAKKNNYIASIYVRPTEIGLAWLDISTGAFCMQRLEVGKMSQYDLILASLSRLDPVEIIVEDKLMEHPQFFGLFKEFRDKLSVRSRSQFNYTSAINILLKAFKVGAIDAFGDFSKSELIAGGVLLEYVENTQKGALPRIDRPKHIVGEDILEIDASTRRSLEILSPNSIGGSCLLRVLDKTSTGIGGRLLAQRLAMPVMNIKVINDRLDMVEFFYDNPDVRREIKDVLLGSMDIERSIGRLSVGRGGPKDLFDLAITLDKVPYVKNIINGFKSYQKDSMYADVPAELRRLVDKFYDHGQLVNNIFTLLGDDRSVLPQLARNGGFIKEGAYPPLDYLRDIRKNSVAKCEELRQKYAEETGVSGLKVKNNSVVGYYVEVPTRFADAIFENKKFIHKQTVLNAVRFTTDELCELENEVLSADERAIEMEIKLFVELEQRILAQADAIIRSAEIMAEIDVAVSLAFVAVENGFIRPIINDGLDFEIIEGRHPVVEEALRKDGEALFVGNDCCLKENEDHIWLITGPNMAGKSTFLRQNALIVIMAQMGGFVPAKSAKFGVVDKIFSRVGASDDLARGRSTFMVEMVETASILNQSTKRSFVILDEIGRGTATFDGLSIAWAVVEQLAEVNKCRTLFATHYHELTKLEKRMPQLSLRCMKTKEFNGDVVFMHEVIKGAADRSYGIHVAKLAGLPDLTVKRAEQVLKLLEDEKQNKMVATIENDLPLFEVLKNEVKKEEKNPIIEEIENLNLDNLTPFEALEKLYNLKKML